MIVKIPILNQEVQTYVLIIAVTSFKMLFETFFLVLYDKIMVDFVKILLSATMFVWLVFKTTINIHFGRFLYEMYI